MPSDELLRSAVRCARSAPAATLEDAAAVAGVRLGALERTLMALPERGPCAAAVAASRDAASFEVHPLVVQDRVCPPSTLRVLSGQSVKATRVACAAACAQRPGKPETPQTPPQRPHATGQQAPIMPIPPAVTLYRRNGPMGVSRRCCGGSHTSRTGWSQPTPWHPTRNARRICWPRWL